MPLVPAMPRTWLKQGRGGAVVLLPAISNKHVTLDAPRTGQGQDRARTRQDRTGQDRTGQEQDRISTEHRTLDAPRTGQDRTGQDRAGQGQDRAGEDRTLDAPSADAMQGCPPITIKP